MNDPPSILIVVFAGTTRSCPNACAASPAANTSATAVCSLASLYDSSSSSSSQSWRACECLEAGLLPLTCALEATTLERCAGAVVSASLVNGSLVTTSSACDDEALANVSSRLLDMRTTLSRLDGLVNDAVTPLLRCEPVAAALATARDNVCVHGINSFSTITAGAAMGAGFYLFAVYFGVRGTKRFTKTFRRRLRELKEIAMGRYINVFSTMDKDKSGALDRREMIAIVSFWAALPPLRGVRYICLPFVRV